MLGKGVGDKGRTGKRARRDAAEDAVERLQLFQSVSSTIGQRDMAKRRCAVDFVTNTSSLQSGRPIQASKRIIDCRRHSSTSWLYVHRCEAQQPNFS